MDRDLEDEALRGLVRITVGGKPVSLPTLNMDKSEVWQASIGMSADDIEIPDSATPGQVFSRLLSQSGRVLLDTLLAYDVEGRLGSRESLRKRITQQELYAAVKEVGRAEFPLVTDAHSVAQAFGPQLQVIGLGLLSIVAERLRPESNTNGSIPSTGIRLARSARSSPTLSS